MKQPYTPSTWTRTRASSCSKQSSVSKKSADANIARVLAVDDHADLCELLEIYLEQAGFRVATTRSTRDAWDILTERTQPVDVMIADATLYEADDGLRLVEKARRRFPRLKAIVLSGDVNVRAKALDAGADLVLIKPVAPVALVAEIQRLTTA